MKAMGLKPWEYLESDQMTRDFVLFVTPHD